MYLNWNSKLKLKGVILGNVIRIFIMLNGKKYKFVFICVCWRVVMFEWIFFFLEEYLLNICLILSRNMVVFLCLVVNWVINFLEIFKMIDKVVIILFFFVIEVVILVVRCFWGIMGYFICEFVYFVYVIW